MYALLALRLTGGNASGGSDCPLKTAMDHRFETPTGSPAQFTPETRQVCTRRNYGWRWDLAAAVAFLALVVATCSSALMTAFELGADEHYEVTKAFLWSKGFKLYQEIWNDQPPLLTVVQGLVFKCFGVHVVIMLVHQSVGRLRTAQVYPRRNRQFDRVALSTRTHLKLWVNP